MNLPQTLPGTGNINIQTDERLRFLFTLWLGLGGSLYLFQVSIPGFSVHVRPCEREKGVNEKKARLSYMK